MTKTFTEETVKSGYRAFSQKTEKGRPTRGYIFSCVCALSLAFTVQESAAQAPVTIVDGKYVRRQMEREVITRWNKFDPKWYFILFHNKYRKGEDRRNMLQLLPTMAALQLNEEATKQEEEEVHTIWEQEVFKGADRSLNKSFHLLYGNKIATLNTELDALNAEAVAAGVDFDMLLKLRQEKDRINADIDLTKEAYEDDAVKGEAFRGYLADLLSLRGYYRRIIHLFRTADNLSK
ncbi:hypothetical protein CLV24_105124 [Pontibacter ummariensis]|uniref:Uncharacterized protein n=1 Tax=Pontibacter ummariensis TaxID=1610492 RepID=A0A239DW71_9BACT|nr:hypothetical protein [Pontibacter ummariensis]PRY13754.1 hypothetical protein CLV24_105124 [Pontibacter ummariensis]SNS35973.1 hypothetical protein SAMN06296052_105128 [Pontibacter ummariensis]